MKQTRIVTMLCLIAGIAHAQQNMRGSDTLALYTRGLITDLGLGSQLNYLGGGSGLGIADAVNSRTTGQTVNPASRAVNQNEINAAAANNLQFVDYVLGLDGIVITVNDVGNANLTGIRFSDLRRIYQCTWTNWTSVPTSTRTDDILAMARDENSGTTDVFQSRVGGFNTSPPDNWWNTNYPCVNVCRGDGCTQIIGSTTASIPNAIGFSGAPGLASGNRDLLISNDNLNPPTPLVRFSEASVRDLSYQFARQLHMYKVIGITDGYGPTGAQATLLMNGAQNCGCNCPRLAANGFFSVTADYCTSCTATCP
jgi:ABC-type phosphate transport system substrate-binding protein